MSAVLPVALLMGMVLGASAHRAGLCTVKAVDEVLTARRAHVFWSFVKAALWTTAILAWASLFGAEAELARRPVLAGGIVGGLIFGIGAGLNGACVFSTLSRLAEGHAVMLSTLVGWAAAMALVQIAPPALAAPAARSVVPAVLAMPLTLWSLWELWRIWQRRASVGAGFRSGFWALSPAVLLIAVANSTLLLLDRPWSFTSTALCSSGAFPLAPCRQTGMLWAISLAALATMFGSALMRRSFRLRRPKVRGVARHLAAGLAMGTGASLLPGGNDGLILFGLPALSPHALSSWLAILIGIVISLTVLRTLGLRLPRISCDGDVCRSLP